MLFDHPMSPKGNAGVAYGEAITYRVTGAARAAPLGAVAVLVRSLTTRSLGAPHTGSMRLLEGKAKNIPAACVSVEDAELLHRLATRGDKPKLHLTLRPQTLPDAQSANVLGEIRGRELPDEIVLIGAHLDSRDVGQGAQDDGAGVVTVMQALTTLRSLGLIPRRTLRAVLFSNEENGRRGAAQYAKAHDSELAGHVAAFEMDAGLFGVMLDLDHYFDVHHSAADTLDKVDPEHLQKAVAALATFSFIVADRPGTWRAPPPSRAQP